MCSWDTRQMFFGAGTKLIVEAQNQAPSRPSVFVMKSEKHFACLVKDFYPKAIKVDFVPDIKISDTAIALTTSGKYSAVKIGQSEDKDSVICSVKHRDETINSTNFETDSSGPLKPTKSTDKKQSPGPANTQKTPESKNEGEQTSGVHNKPKATVYPEKVNMMSLTVLGLRMWFAKSVAINVFLTAKLFFF